jgi:arylsulfatase A-like enzyme
MGVEIILDEGDLRHNRKPRSDSPGFDGMAAEVTLSYVAALHEHGVNVTFAYISDVHDNHVTAAAFGPGEAGYVAALRDYDQAFGVFFARLAADGITAANTLFIFTADEGDHFVGGPPSPANCDGVNVPCTYQKIGEIDASLDRLLKVEDGVTTQFAAHFDSAPTIHINGNPAQFAPTTFGLEVAMSGLVAINPITQNQDELAVAFADRTMMKLLHMVTQDPARTPSFTMFGDPDYFFLTSPTDTCNSPANCVVEAAAFAWNHGDIQPEITTTWLGMAGPGVRHLGVTREVWPDHADIRPTLLALVGLDDDCTHDGIPLFEFTRSGSSGGDARSEAARIYKQLNAPIGEFGLGVIALITQAIKNHDPVGDAQTVGQLEALGADRDRIAAALRSVLDAPSSEGSKSDEQNVSGLIDDADRLLARVADLGQAPDMHDGGH